MNELTYLGIIFAVICITAVAVLRSGKVKGLRSFRGALLLLLMIGSWGVGWFASLLFVPLGIACIVLIQTLALRYVAKLTTVKSVLLSAAYTLFVATFSVLLSILAFGYHF